MAGHKALLIVDAQVNLVASPPSHVTVTSQPDVPVDIIQVFVSNRQELEV